MYKTWSRFLSNSKPWPSNTTSPIQVICLVNKNKIPAVIYDPKSLADLLFWPFTKPGLFSVLLPRAFFSHVLTLISSSQSFTVCQTFYFPNPTLFLTGLLTGFSIREVSGFTWVHANECRLNETDKLERTSYLFREEKETLLYY